MKKIYMSLMLSLGVLVGFGQTTVFINEIHYDNASTDVGEGAEIAGPAGTDLTEWSLVAYNGSNGTQYSTTSLSGTIPDAGSGFGFIWFATGALQNGAPDGLALIDNNSQVVQFLSYEGGNLTATDGPAIGLSSIDIGVSETSSTSVGFSLQLGGTGLTYEDFTWQTEQLATINSVNTGQTFAAASDPIISFSSSLILFETTEGQVSASQSFEVSGNNLTNDVTITAPSGFEVSSDDATFSSSITFTQAGGDLTGEPVIAYTRVATSATAGSLNDVIILSSTGASDQPVTVSAFIASSTPISLPYDASFETEPDGWYIYSVASANTWTYSSSGYYQASSFNDDAPGEDWLISPRLDGSNSSNIHLSFDNKRRFEDLGLPAEPLSIWYSEDYLGIGDPTSATWVEVTTQATFNAYGSSSDPYTFSDYVDISSVTGDFFVAFKYLSSGTGSDATAQIRVGEFSVGEFTEWTGAWSHGAPDASTYASISGTYGTGTDGDITALDLFVQPGLLTVADGGVVKVEKELVNAGEIMVQSGGSLVLMGSISDTDTENGSYFVMRNSTGNGGYSILGSPMTSTLLTDLNSDFLYSYDEVNSAFAIPTGDMISGVGYFVGYNAASPTVSFTGTPTTGTVTTPLSFDGSGFNLIANPYAAAISMSMFRASNSTDTDGAIYLWDDGGTNEGAVRGGDYITVNDMGEVSTVDLAGTGIKGEGPAGNGFITSTQGFFVLATDEGSATFNPDMQVTTTGANADANHYREIDNKQLIRLAVSGNGLYNEILIGLTENATFEKDHGLDALKFSGNELISFYSMQADDKFAIQALPSLTSEVMEVQLGMDLAEAGEYTLSLQGLEGFNENVSVMILDNLTGELYDLNETSEISFTNSESVFTSKRFELVLSPSSVLGFDALSVNTDLIVFANEQGLNIKTKEAFSNAQVKIYSLSGSVVASFNKVDFSERQSVIAFDKKGLFVVAIQSENGLMIKKFLN